MDHDHDWQKLHRRLERYTYTEGDFLAAAFAFASGDKLRGADLKACCGVRNDKELPVLPSVETWAICGGFWARGSEARWVNTLVPCAQMVDLLRLFVIAISIFYS